MTVTMLSDGYLDVSFELLSGIDGSRAEELLQKRGASALPRININVYVIQTRERTILVVAVSMAGAVGFRLLWPLPPSGADCLTVPRVIIWPLAECILTCQPLVRLYEMAAALH